MDCRIHVRGDVKKLGESVPRGLLQVINSTPTALPSNSSGRLELARWIASAENPLTARVMVNRIWIDIDRYLSFAGHFFDQSEFDNSCCNGAGDFPDGISFWTLVARDLAHSRRDVHVSPSCLPLRSKPPKG